MTWTDESRFLYAHRFADRYREAKLKMIRNEKKQPDIWRAPLDIRWLVIGTLLTAVVGAFLIEAAVRWLA